MFGSRHVGIFSYYVLSCNYYVFLVSWMLDVLYRCVNKCKKYVQNIQMMKDFWGLKCRSRYELLLSMSVVSLQQKSTQLGQGSKLLSRYTADGLWDRNIYWPSPTHTNFLLKARQHRDYFHITLSWVHVGVVCRSLNAKL